MFCREQAALYSERRFDFEDVGAKLRAIGNGSPLMARDFVERFEIKFPVYTDPSRESYRAAGLKRGIKLNRKLLLAGVRAVSQGFIQGRTRGHPGQQGGVLVIGVDEDVLFSHADGNAGDHADLGAVLASLR